VQQKKYGSTRNKAIGSISAAFLIINLAACSTASGQGLRSRPPVKTTDQVVEEMRSRLNLNEEQKTQIRPILEEQREKREAIMERYRDQGRSAKVYMQDDMATMELETQAKMAKILTEEQLEEYRKMVTEQKARTTGQKSRGGRRGGGRKGF
jgi:Spy/CpxP family protein refolding chaperone